jgi:LuxR family maltose regulon positive regulatory protein
MVYRLILIVAPRWDGNIAWLIDWMSQLQRTDHTRLAWVALCPDDDAPFRFWSDVLDALQDADGELIDLLTLKPEITLPFCLNESIEDLINVLADVDGQFFLVFEGYHLIRTQEIHRAIQFLLDYLPDSTHLVIVSQTDPPLQLSRLRVRRQMIEIRVDES